VARALVSGKILNQRTLLRRNLDAPDRRLIGRLALYARQARHARDLGTLLGIEGVAAQEYFAAFPGLFRGMGAWAGPKFAAAGRNRRPPRDEVNAVLSFLYALLVKDCTVTAQAVGFDPFRGLYHAPKYGRPALGLDLCEEFRPLVADSTCVTLFNQGELNADDFVGRARGVALTPAGRRAVLAGYERRMNQMVTHPVFGYTIGYRRVLEVQARLLRAVLLGEIAAYRPFTTR
jgi:CRISPR-associated protein Cas1